MNRPVRHLAGDPDPLYVEPGPVRRDRPPRQAHRDRSGMVIVYLVGMLLVILAVVIVFAAPRGASDPSSSAHPTAPDQALHGAPQQERSGITPDVERGAVARRPRGGAPLVPAAVMSGTATWYCGAGQRGTTNCTIGYGPGDLVAAIDPTLGLAKGSRIRVRYGDNAVTVRIVDVCACGGRRLVDLTSGAFGRLAPLGRGVIPVTIEALSSSSSPTLPPTDTENDGGPS